MTEGAQNLINAFSALPVLERHAVLVELARISEADAGMITDEDLTRAGDELFAMYDAEEADRGETNQR